MKKIYGKLAVTNMKNNKQLYLPYLLTAMLSVVMFYTMVALRYNSGIRQIRGGYNLLNFLSLGQWVIGIFVVIFLFYTNSFIMKRRKKELGIYNILGMEKKHIANVLFIETGLLAATSIVGGLIFGIVFNKLFIMILYKIIHFSSPVQFELSAKAIQQTCILFVGIFLVTLIYNLLQVKLAKPIELLRGGNTGEKEPKTKVIMTILGIICVGIGYYIALTTDNPLTAIMLFFVAVIFVILGTYLLFTAGSIAFLKMLRKNKNFYYKTNHFTAVSGMLYRMKQNAVGLANICILSTMVLVIISCTASMFIGVDDELKTRFPSELMIEAYTKELVDCEEVLEAAKKEIKENGNKLLAEKSYFGFTVFTRREKEGFVGAEDMMKQAVDYSKIQGLMFLTPEGGKAVCDVDAKDLAEDEVIICGSPKYKEKTVSFFGKQFKVAKSKEFKLEEDSYAMLGGIYYVILPNETVLATIYDAQKKSFGEYASDYMYGVNLDMDGTKKEKIAAYEAVKGTLKKMEAGNGLDSKKYVRILCESRAGNEDDFFMMYGGFFFLGIFLGTMFLMVTVLIIYFKQISEGYDDKERFVIMQKVGMSNKEVKASIRSQVRTVFLLPIIVATIHVAFAYPIVIKLLALFNLTNEGLFRLCLVGTIVVFTIIYYIVFKCTSGVYYKIVGNHVMK